MSRTRRTSVGFRRNGAREGFGAMSCSGGRSCVWCASGRTHRSVKTETFSREDVAQAERDGLTHLWLGSAGGDAVLWAAFDDEPEWPEEDPWACSCCCCMGTCNSDEDRVLISDGFIYPHVGSDAHCRCIPCADAWGCLA